MRYIISILLYKLIVVQSFAFTGKYPIQNFTATDYKAGIQNIDLAQNRGMSIFIANNLGVLSYSGNNWEVHDFIAGKKVRSLAFDEDTNRLYVGSQGSFGYYKDDWDYIPLDTLVPDEFRDFDEVWDVFIIDSYVYFCTFQGIYLFDGNSVSTIRTEMGFDRSFEIQGKLYSQSLDGQIFEIVGRKLLKPYPDIILGERIAGLIPYEGELIIVYNTGEMNLFGNFGMKKILPELSYALQGKYVNHVLQLSDSRLTISTQRGGIFLYDLLNKTIENLNKADGLNSNACLRAFQDYSGNLWVGMQNGIALIDINAPMRFIGGEINLQGSGYEAFEVDGGIYFTTSNGIFYLENEADLSEFLTGTEGPAYGIQRIDGRIYAGHHNGMYLLNEGEATKVAETDGLWQIKKLKSRPGYAIGGGYSGLYIFKLDGSQTLRKVHKVAGFDESSRFFEENQNGKILVGQFYKGLYEIELNQDLSRAKVRTLTDLDEFPGVDQITLNSIDEDLYLGTNSGLFKLEYINGQFVRQDPFSNKIGEQSIYLVQQDNYKNIHIITEDHVGFFKRIGPNNYAFVASSLYKLRYSFNNDLLNVSTNIKQGVFFNANEGFILYHPDKEINFFDFKPPIVTTVVSLTEDRKLYKLNPFDSKPNGPIDLILNHKAKVIQIHVESFRFSDKGSQEFRFILSDFDDNSESWTRVPYKEYNNLNEGKYELTVQTRNTLGEIESSEPMLISVKPPIYLSNAAKVFYLLFGILNLIIVLQIQRRRYIRKLDKLEEAKRLKLARKQSELEAMSREKELAIMQIEERKVKAEMDLLNNQLVSSTMNLVIKNEFIENIMKKLKEVGRLERNIETRAAVGKIIKEIDLAIHIQKDWERFEHHFNQVHGDFFSRLRREFAELTPNEQKLCAFLRLNLDTKGISNLMGISHRGVEIARYRLRRKLNLGKGQNLSKFILEY